MKMTIYAYFRKLITSTSVMLRLKLPRVLKFTLAGTAGNSTHNNSFGKKPVASTVVTMRFKQFVGMSSGLANMTKFKSI